MTTQFQRTVSAFVFYALLAVIALSAIPYGTVQPWWKAVFQCSVFILAIVSVLTKLISPVEKTDSSRFVRGLLWPLLAFVVFAFLQTVSLPSFLQSGTLRHTISADVYATRQWILQILTLTLIAWLLLTHANTATRRQRLVDVVVAIGAGSALFGLLRQAVQRSTGFVLAHLPLGYGYAQFINSNHFAFLMELVLGLALGLVICRGVSKTRAVVYVLAALPMWLAIVFANSRGGILSLLCQVLMLALLFSLGRAPRETPTEPQDLANRLRKISRTVAVRGVLLAGVLLVAVTTVVLVGGDPLAGRVDSLAVELDRNTADTYTLRPNIWRATWELVKERPITGVGFGGYWIAITKYHVGSGEMTPQEAHNDYLELLASGGIVGVAIGLWFVFQFAKTARHKLNELKQGNSPENSFERAATLAALTGILTVAIHSLVDFGLHLTINAVIFTILVAIVCRVPCPTYKV